VALPQLDIAGYYWLQWHLHPDVILLCLGLLTVYLYAIKLLRPASDVGRVRRSQYVYFGLGVLVIYIAAGSPVHDLSEQYLLSVHMFQHLLLTLVAPPLLLAGVPTWVWERTIAQPRLRPVSRAVLNPILAIGVFNFLLVVTHLPSVVDLALREHAFHFFVHALLVTSALMMWWPVITNVPGLPRLTYPYQMGYLFVQSLLPAVIGSMITFSRSPVYDFYAQAPRIWGLSAVEDQQFGALIMKLVGSMILWSFIGVAFFKWYAKEEAESQGPRWDEVEEELRELGLQG
jgi:putative membrane protein